MSEETKEPAKLAEIAKRNEEKRVAKMSVYNNSVMAGVGIRPSAVRQPQALSDLPYTQLIRHSYIRGIFATVDALWHESSVNSYSLGSHVDIDEDKIKARKRIKVLENAIDLLKLVEGV